MGRSKCHEHVRVRALTRRCTPCLSRHKQPMKHFQAHRLDLSGQIDASLLYIGWLQTDPIVPNAVRSKTECPQHSVFLSGHPSQYYPSTTLLNFGVRTRAGVFNVIWPWTLGYAFTTYLKGRGAHKNDLAQSVRSKSGVPTALSVPERSPISVLSEHDIA